MNRDEAREYIRTRGREYFERDKSGKGYVCPICGSGRGNGVHGYGTGITTKDGIHFTCWAGCFTNADVIQIIGQRYGIDDYNGQLERACEEFHIELEKGYRQGYSVSPVKKSAYRGVNSCLRGKSRKGFGGDMSAYFLQAGGNNEHFYESCAREIERTDYHRGISLETLKRFRVGYAEYWRHPKAGSPNVPLTPRLIIPVSTDSYIARDTRPDSEIPPKQKRFIKMRVGHMRIFNEDAIYSSHDAVYVVEGELDALSIIDAGVPAVGLGSVTNINNFLAKAKKKPSGAIFIIAMDKDNAGQKSAQEMASKMSEEGISFYRHDLPEGIKDANEYLQKSHADFTEWVKAGVMACKEKRVSEIEPQREEFERESVAYYLNGFLKSISASREGKAIATGFDRLDDLLDGGLYPGFYVVGAISSLGKTTLVMQIADSVAISGHKALIFSLEMSRNELIAKSLSRLMFQRDKVNAKTTRGILRGEYSGGEYETFCEALEKYSEYASNIHITEGTGNVGIKEIRDHVERYLRIYHDKPPVVFIDYLQILSPYDVRATDKQNTDKAVLELKRLSRDYEVPVIGISSFNRENYTLPVSMASFKESGAIEYSSDVLIGLQYSGWDYREGERDAERTRRLRTALEEINRQAMNGSPVSVQLKVIKNRNGRRGKVLFEFYPRFNYFQTVKTFQN